MLELILYIIICSAIAIAITTEYIFAPIRKLPWKKSIKKLLSCAPCFSFHLGWVLFWIWKPYTIGLALGVEIIGGALLVYLFTKIISTWITNNSFLIE